MSNVLKFVNADLTVFRSSVQTTSLHSMSKVMLLNCIRLNTLSSELSNLTVYTICISPFFLFFGIQKEQSENCSMYDQIYVLFSCLSVREPQPS